MSRIKHISFDLDGTLINSFPIMEIAWNASMKALNLNCNFLKYKRLVGMPFPTILELLSMTEYEGELTKLYFSHTKKLAGDVKAFYGVQEVFNWALMEGYSTSIITSKPRENAEILCSKLQIPTELLVCGDDHRYGKPNAFVADSVLEKHQLDPKDVIYVGDMAVDLQFAINVGMNFVFFGGDGLNRLPCNLVNKFLSISCLTELINYDFDSFFN